MKKFKLVACILAVVLLFAGCTSSTTAPIDPENIRFRQFEEILPNDEVAVVKTSIGTIYMVLFGDEAPETVAHFKKLAEEGFYDNQLIFAQADSNTLISGAADESGGSGKIVTEDGKPLEAEVTPNLWHFSGAVSVFAYQANRFSNDYLADSRFFIIGEVKPTAADAEEMGYLSYPENVIEQYKAHGGMLQFTGACTVFGQVYEGLELVTELSQMETTGDWKALKDAVIESIEITTYKEAEAAKAAADTTDDAEDTDE